MSFARVRALVVVGLLAVVALVFVVIAVVKDTQGTAGTAASCPDGCVRRPAGPLPAPTLVTPREARPSSGGDGQ